MVPTLQISSTFQSVRGYCPHYRHWLIWLFFYRSYKRWVNFIIQGAFAVVCAMNVLMEFHSLLVCKLICMKIVPSDTVPSVIFMRSWRKTLFLSPPFISMKSSLGFTLKLSPQRSWWKTPLLSPPFISM